MTDTRKGVLALVAACAIWGLSGLFYKALSDVPSHEVLAHRTVWSLVFFGLVLGLQGRLHMLWRAVGNPASRKVIAAAAIFISINWFLFIFSVQSDHVVEASLGYYMFPLVAVLLATVVLKERLAPLQWLAVGLAALAVTQLTLGLGVAPWISLVIALTFGLYGLVKKRLTVGAMTSVTAEVLVLTPLGLGWLVHVHWNGGGVFGADIGLSALLLFSGVLTALPLILFSAAAQRVNMATLGLLQYLNPTLQFFCAVVLFGEPLNTFQLVAFALIWIALAIYSFQSLSQERARRRSAMVSRAEPPL